jgi:teichuronic acid biosynthesis glycosyltransferase TuaC
VKATLLWREPSPKLQKNLTMSFSREEQQKGEIRVLVLTTMYPRRFNRMSGGFIHEQVRHSGGSGCRGLVFCSVPYAPRCLWLNPKWKEYGEQPLCSLIDGIPVYYLRYLNLPGAWFHSLSAYAISASLARADSLIRDFKPHLIHAHAATPSGYSALHLKKRYDLPVVCSLRGSDINIYPRRDRTTLVMTKKVISEADRVTSVSGALKKAAMELASPREEIEILYNGCDHETFSYSRDAGMAVRRRLGIPEYARVLIFVGHLTRSKGIFELADCHANLLSAFPDLHLIVVGDGPERETFAGLASSRGMDNVVHLVGRQQPEEIPQFLSAADLFIFPSHYEGLPNALLEAMACSLPVVATRTGGIPEAVQDGENGLLADRMDTASLTSAVRVLIEDSAIAARMGRNGRAIIEKKFSWKKNAESLAGIYRSLCEKK